MANTSYFLVQLEPGQPEYENVLVEFSNENIKVAKIERLQSISLSKRFNSELEEMKTTHTPDFNPNVRYLYHCTCVEKSRICEGGLDQRLSRKGHFGTGIYFSDSPLKCLHYSEYVNHPDRAMILKCRVILGDCKIFEPRCFDPNLIGPSERENPTDGYRYYDSVKGSPTDFNEYVVYQNCRVMVEHIISFELDKEMKKSIKPMHRQKGEKEKASSGKAWKYVAIGLGGGLFGFVATPLIVTAALGTVGFTAGGVAAGSIAAAIQATIGNVAAGSAFAMAQSAAATGVVSAVTQLAGGTILGTMSAAVMKLLKSKPNKDKKSDENK